MTFFTPSLTFISEKNILSNLLIIILPCIVRILRQNIQKLATELHLAVLRNKKGGDAGSRHGRGLGGAVKRRRGLWGVA